MPDPQTPPGSTPAWEHPLGDVLAWPRTPSKRRLDRAAGLSDQEPPTKGIAAQRQKEDANNYRQYLKTPQFSQKALQELRKERPRLTRRDQLLSLLTRIAREGDTPNTIGVAMERRTDPDNVTYIFTRLQRHPDWMGFCPLLPNIDRLSAEIIESTSLPGKPGLVLAIPHDLAQPSPQTRFPRGEATTLENLLKWHGAFSNWIPLELSREAQYTTGN